MTFKINKLTIIFLIFNLIANIFSSLYACNFDSFNYDCVDSTYSRAISAPRSQNWQVHRAREQTVGIERPSRISPSRWISPAAKNLYLTYVVPTSTSKIPLMIHSTQACCVAVAKTLEYYGLKPQIKWPNDVLINDKKISGIGVEISLTPSGSSTFINVGLNVNMNKQLCSTIDQPAISMAVSANKEFDTEQVLEVLNDNICKCITEIENEKFGSEILPYLVNHMPDIGKEITINVDSYDDDDCPKTEILKGIFKGLGPKGNIILTVDGKDQDVWSGSIVKESKPKILSPPIADAGIKVLQTPIEEQKVKILSFPMQGQKAKIQITYPAKDTGMQVLTAQIPNLKEATDKAYGTGFGEPKPTKNDGLKWQDSEKCKYGIRLMPGDTNAEYDSQKEPYVKIVRDGQIIGTDQKEVKPTKEFPFPSDNPKSHISQEEWVKWKTIYGEDK